MNTWSVLKAFSQKKGLKGLNTTSVVLITATSQKTAASEQPQDL